MNRFVWNMRHADARGVPGDVLTERSLTGPVVPPGRYEVELDVDGRRLAAPFEIRVDPQVKATAADLEAQCAFLLRVRDKLSETHDAVNQMRDVRRQVEEWMRRAAGTFRRGAGERRGAGARRGHRRHRAGADRAARPGRGRSPALPNRLNVKLAGLTSVASTADAAPTRQALEVFEELSARVDGEIARWRALRDSEVKAFGELIRRLEIPAVSVSPASP